MLTAELTTQADKQVAGVHDLAGLRLEVVRRLLSERRSKIRGSRVLNVGCDDGALETLFADWGAIEITGIDTDEILIESLQTSRPEFEYRRADLAESMPDFLQGRTFDLVTAIGVLGAAWADEESTLQMLRHLCSLCRPEGGMLLWTAPQRPQDMGPNLGQACPIIFSEYNMSRRVSCPILYVPERLHCRWTKRIGSDLGWPILTHGMDFRLSRPHEWGGRSRPAGITCHAGLAERRANSTAKRVPIHRVGSRGDFVRIAHRRELKQREKRIAPCASDDAARATYPDGWRRWIKQDPAVTTSGGGGGGRALLISYTFPPTGGSGVQRPAKLTKYLPAFGWNVDVLTTTHERFPWQDESLLADIPSDGRVHRVSGYEPACLAQHFSAALRRIGRFLPKRLRSGDNHLLGREIPWIEERIYWRLALLADRLGLDNGESLWIAPAVRTALRLHRRNPFDVVISTGPPHFVHHVAKRIAHAAGIPWIAELRDPLIHDYFAVAPAHKAAMRRFEKVMMRSAERVVTTSSSFADDLRTRYPQRAPTDILTISNGFDRDDIVTALDFRHDPVCEPEEFVFVAAGSFYGRSELRRFVDPLSKVLERNPQWQGRVRLIVAGTLDTHQRQYWEQNRPAWMTLRGYLDHASVVRLIADASCAMLMLSESRTARMCVPGKMFELFALPTHMLALVPPDSETGRMILKAQASTVVSPENDKDVASAIERIIAGYFRNQLSCERNWPALDVYDRKAIAGAYAECMSLLCRKG